MSHGDKIPDLVKDPEVNDELAIIVNDSAFNDIQAEAEYEALKGLLEDNILKKIRSTSSTETPSAATVPASRLVARKSTDPESRARVGDVCRNVARKSTGPDAKCWPETRIENPYSFYGIPAEPFDPKAIKTRMAMGE